MTLKCVEVGIYEDGDRIEDIWDPSAVGIEGEVDQVWADVRNRVEVVLRSSFHEDAPTLIVYTGAFADGEDRIWIDQPVGFDPMDERLDARDHIEATIEEQIQLVRDEWKLGVR